MKMYVWKNVLHNAGFGMICVLASSLEEALTTAREQLEDYEFGELSKDYEEFATPTAVRCWGSS